jgi:hypothetical protein
MTRIYSACPDLDHSDGVAAEDVLFRQEPDEEEDEEEQEDEGDGKDDDDDDDGDDGYSERPSNECGSFWRRTQIAGSQRIKTGADS